MTLFSEKRPLPKCSAYPSNYNCRKVTVIRRFPYLSDHAPRDDARSTGNSKFGEEGNILPVKDSEPNDMECETSIPMLSKANVEEALGQWVTVDNDVEVLVKTPYQPKPVDVPETITTEVEPITRLDNHASRVDAGSTGNSKVGEEGNTLAVRKSERSERNYMECETTKTILSNTNVEEAHWQWVTVDNDIDVLVKTPDQPKPSNLLENITEAEPITRLDISTFLSHTLARVSKYPSTKIPKVVTRLTTNRDFPLCLGRRNDMLDSNMVVGNKCGVEQMQVVDTKRTDGKQIEVQIQDGKCFKKQLEDNALEEMGDKICGNSVQLIHCETDTNSIDDISQGKEEKPVRVINTVDDEKLPPFCYIANVIYPEWYKSNHSVPRGCGCINGCVDFEICSCTVRYEGDIPFTLEGSIVRRKHLVYECGPSCKCPPSCQNRVSQNGIRYRLEIFKTEKMGWGVRSRDFIQSGGFVCEYTGELLQEQEAEERVGDDEYLFDIGRDGSGFTIDAAKFGNVGRFINHSCSPNLYAQNVLYDHRDKRMPHIMFFATENIPPLRELTYDYNYKVGRVRDANGNTKRKDCYCGSRMCSGRLY